MSGSLKKDSKLYIYKTLCVCALCVTLPHQAPWWREREALQCGVCAAQKHGQQRRCSRSQTVTCDDQLILLHRNTHKSTRSQEIHRNWRTRLSQKDQKLLQVRCWTPGSKSHHSLVSCRCNLLLEKCPVTQTEFKLTSDMVLMDFVQVWYERSHLVSVTGSWHAFNWQILTFSREVRQHVLRKTNRQIHVTTETPARLLWKTRDITILADNNKQ